MDLSEQPGSGAALRRRQRRLRSWLRHERKARFLFLEPQWSTCRCMAITEPLGGEGSDDCARGGDTSSRRWLQSWPRTSTTVPHGDRGRPGQGGAREEPHGYAPDDASPGGWCPALCDGRRGGRWGGTSRRAASTVA